MKFVVALDDSDERTEVLDHALDLVEAVGGSLTVVHAVDPQVYNDVEGGPVARGSDAERVVLESIESAEERGLTVLDDAAETAGERDVEADTELLYGDPVEEVAAFAAAGDYDGIIVGHRSLSASAARVVGSVAKGLVEEATVPVTVVK